MRTCAVWIVAFAVPAEAVTPKRAKTTSVSKAKKKKVAAAKKKKAKKKAKKRVARAKLPRKPTVVVAKTVKGKGYSKLEDKGGWHGKASSPEDAEEAIAELGGIRNITVDVPKPEHGEPHRFKPAGAEWPRYEVGTKVATRKAYGEALAALGGDRGDVVALDGEVVPRGSWDDVALSEGARVEVVQAVQGG